MSQPIAIIPAAGLGTRMRPTTDYIPKELIPIWKKPAIMHSIEEAESLGIKDIRVVSSESKRESISWCIQNRASILIQEKMLGLCDAVYVGCDGKVPDGGAFVLLPDEYIPGGLYALSKAKANILVMSIPESERSKYGMISSEGNKIIEVKEKPKLPCGLENGIIGRYYFDDDFLRFLFRCAEGHRSDWRIQEMSLTPVFNEYRKGLLCHHWNGIRYDMGTHSGWIKAFVRESLNDCSENDLSELKEILSEG